MTLDVLLRSGAASAIWSSLYSIMGISCFPAVVVIKQTLLVETLVPRKQAALDRLTWSTCLGMLLSLSTAPANKFA